VSFAKCHACQIVMYRITGEYRGTELIDLIHVLTKFFVTDITV